MDLADGVVDSRELRLFLRSDILCIVRLNNCHLCMFCLIGPQQTLGICFFLSVRPDHVFFLGFWGGKRLVVFAFLCLTSVKIVDLIRVNAHLHISLFRRKNGLVNRNN